MNGILLIAHNGIWAFGGVVLFFAFMATMAQLNKRKRADTTSDRDNDPARTSDGPS